MGFCGLVKAQDFKNKPEEAGIEDIASLGEERIQIVAVVLQSKEGIFDAKAHFGRLQRHIKLIQELEEVGVVSVVTDDESGVYFVVLRTCALIEFNRNGVSMATDVVVGLEDGDAMCATQQMSGSQTRDAATYYSYVLIIFRIHAIESAQRADRASVGHAVTYKLHQGPE